jgi:DNA polymerase/3'-5' exonuclease PolX
VRESAQALNRTDFKSSTINPMKLEHAQNLATRIVEELQPYCSRIEVAGSIRRGLPEVNDIDLVLIPSNPSALRDRILRRCTIIQDGPQNLLVRLPRPPGGEGRGEGVQLDIFIARAETRDLLEAKPSNWGTLLLCRTGSKEHNIKLAQRASRLDLQWKVYEGIFRGRDLLASATEQDIFKALEMDYIEPKNRI